MKEKDIGNDKEELEIKRMKRQPSSTNQVNNITGSTVLRSREKKFLI